MWKCKDIKCEYISICIIQKVSKVLNIFTSMKFENINIYIYKFDYFSTKYKLIIR